MEPVKKIRIILADMPAMLRHIIAEIIALHPDLTIVESTSDSTDLAAAARRTRADVLISQQASSEEFINMAPLFARCHLKIIAITEDARHGSIYELRPFREPLKNLSVDSLIAAIRTTVGSH